MKLMVVESPHKAETISVFLKDEDEPFIVVATQGHIKNLPKQEFAVTHTADGKYIGKWELISGKKKIINNIKEIAQKATDIYIATDDDREGERIAWDVIENLKLKTYHRIIFHEITKTAVLEAIKNSTQVNHFLVKAQIARRLIDRILGYKISDMLRDFFKKNHLVPQQINANKLGIGRVSALALALIVKNEEKIENFKPKTYQKVRVDYMYDNVQFSVKSKLLFDDSQQEQLKQFLTLLKNYDKYPHIVETLKRSTRELPPPPPLTTSWLLRGMSNLYGFPPDKTMKLAQELYEGIPINTKQGKKRTGLITYMRTDSYNISNNAIYEISRVVAETFGEEYLFSNKRKYKTKNNSAQEAHEAIRPTNFDKRFFPKALRGVLTEEQYHLYSFIFYRTIALQMKSSIYDNSGLILNINNNKLYGYANKMLFDGWEKIGKLWKNENDEVLEEYILPEKLHIGQELKPLNVTHYPYTEKTPARYGIGRFITVLEQHEIARPSTVPYVSKSLEQKGYIKVINTMQHPLELGKKVYYFLEEYAPELIDLEHGKKFEKYLDDIAQGEKEPDELIAEYESIADEMAKKLNYVKKSDAPPEQWLVNKMLFLSKKYNIVIPDQAFNTYENAIMFIKKYDKSIGKCPSCKTKNSIMEDDKKFYCKNKECNFILWKDSFSFFFKNFHKEVNPNFYSEYLRVILKKGKCYIEDLKNKKNFIFGAYIELEYNQQYKKYDIKLKINKGKKDKAFLQQFVVSEDSCDNSSKDNSQKSNVLKQTTQDKSSKKSVFISDEIREQIAKQTFSSQNLTSSANKQSESNIAKEEVHKELQKLKKERRMLIDAATKDYLTRAYNRSQLNKDLVYRFSKISLGESLAIAFIDLDHFKKVNDTYGHQTGDVVLQKVVTICFNILKESDISTKIYRYGGEEFLILFYAEKEKIDKVKIATILNTIRSTVEQTILSKAKNMQTKQNENVRCTISIGVSFYENGDTIGSIIERADKAVYAAKNNGRNRIEY